MVEIIEQHSNRNIYRHTNTYTTVNGGSKYTTIIIIITMDQYGREFTEIYRTVGESR